MTRQRNSVILRLYDTADGRSMMVNLSGTERWRELCRLLDIDDGGLDYGTPEGLAKLSDREWNRAKLDEITAAFAAKTADEWESALRQRPAAVAKCNSLAEWLASEQAQVNELVSRDRRSRARTGVVAGPARSGSRPTPASAGRDGGTAASRAHWPGTASSTSRASGPARWPRASWPSSARRWSRWSRRAARAGSR